MTTWCVMLANLTFRLGWPVPRGRHDLLDMSSLDSAPWCSSPVSFSSPPYSIKDKLFTRGLALLAVLSRSPSVLLWSMAFTAGP